MSTTYLRDADNGYRAGYVYGRTDNASVQQAECLIAALEGADDALLFGSGMAAATCGVPGARQADAYRRLAGHVLRASAPG